MPSMWYSKWLFTETRDLLGDPNLENLRGANHDLFHVIPVNLIIEILMNDLGIFIVLFYNIIPHCQLITGQADPAILCPPTLMVKSSPGNHCSMSFLLAVPKREKIQQAHLQWLFAACLVSVPFKTDGCRGAPWHDISKCWRLEIWCCSRRPKEDLSVAVSLSWSNKGYSYIRLCICCCNRMEVLYQRKHLFSSFSTIPARSLTQ